MHYITPYLFSVSGERERPGVSVIVGGGGGVGIIRAGGDDIESEDSSHYQGAKTQITAGIVGGTSGRSSAGNAGFNFTYALSHLFLVNNFAYILSALEDEVSFTAASGSNATPALGCTVYNNQQDEVIALSSSQDEEDWENREKSSLRSRGGDFVAIRGEDRSPSYLKNEMKSRTANHAGSEKQCAEEPCGQCPVFVQLLQWESVALRMRVVRHSAEYIARA